MVTKIIPKKRGGPRPGAGRPKGSMTVKTTVAAARILTAARDWEKLPEDKRKLHDDATPLDVMVEAMREAYRIAGPIGAVPYAEKAAPYLHAKMASLELGNTQTPGAKGGKSEPFKFEVVFVNAKDGRRG